MMWRIISASQNPDPYHSSGECSLLIGPEGLRRVPVQGDRTGHLQNGRIVAPHVGFEATVESS